MSGTGEETNKVVWSVYVWWSCILVLKMYTLAWFTGRIRVAKQVIHSEEDYMWMKNKSEVIICSTGDGHPDVIRIRNAHQYDLATVIPFLFLIPFWLHTSPSPFLVRHLIPYFAITSILYTSSQTKLINLNKTSELILFSSTISVLLYVSIASIIYYSLE